MRVDFRIGILSLALLAALPAGLVRAAGPGYPQSPYGRVQGASAYVARQQAPAPLSAPPESVVSPTPDPMFASEAFDPTWDTSFASESCDSGFCDDGCCTPGRSGMWYGSVDYLLVRPRFSQGTAAIRRHEVSTEESTSETFSLIEQSIQYPYEYNSAFRAGIGYRFLDCGGDLQLTYWRMTGDSGTVDERPGEDTFVFGQVKNNAGPGEFFFAESTVTANIFDIDFSKILSLGGPGGDCCDPCSCPRWDWRWYGGVRIADISRTDRNRVSDDELSQIAFGNVDGRFVGAGPRVGFQGRRYFGQCGLLSVFAKGSQGLLIGDYQLTRFRSVLEQVDPDVIETSQQDDTFARMIPVTDIEIGGSWQVAPYTFVSVGWLFQCWWDLGQTETIGGDLGTLDTANILSFDGLFVRGEMFF